MARSLTRTENFADTGTVQVVVILWWNNATGDNEDVTKMHNVKQKYTLMSNWS